MNATRMEIFDRTMQEDACDVSDKMSARHRYFKRISHVAEQGVLVFVILVTLLGNYVIHSYLMRDMLIS